MKIPDLYKAFLNSTGACTDTRKLVDGNMFFSLKGDNFNGNKYARQAYENGAKYCVVDQEEYMLNDHFFLVEDVLTSLQLLAKHHRQTIGIKILSLTGSNGKTTTKELINAVLSKKYKTVATLGNLNNHIGVPLTLLKMKKDTEIGVVEMGANHLKEIEFLCNIALPDYGLITNFGKAHLEGFGSEENIVRGKSELYVHLRENDGTIIANSTDHKQMEIIKSYQNLEKILLLNPDKLKLISSQPFLKLNYDGTIFTSNLTGRYNFDNIKFAITVGEHFEVEKHKIVNAIKSYVPQNNRSQIVNKGNLVFLLDAYNANPTSMVAALDNFEELEARTKIAILGDMFELGKDAKKEHQYIADYALTKSLDDIFLVGENYYKVENNSNTLKVFKTFEELKTHIKKLELSETTILVKGSRGMALERVLDLF